MTFLPGWLTKLSLRLCVHNHLQVFFKLNSHKPSSKKPDTVKGVYECLFLPSSILSMFSTHILSKTITGASWSITVMLPVNWKPLKHLNSQISLELLLLIFFFADDSGFGVNCFLNLCSLNFQISSSMKLLLSFILDIFLVSSSYSEPRKSDKSQGKLTSLLLSPLRI